MLPLTTQSLFSCLQTPKCSNLHYVLSGIIAYLHQFVHTSLLWHLSDRPRVLLILLLSLVLSGRVGPLPFKGNKLLCYAGHRSDPQGALLQAEWLGAEGEVGANWPYSVWGRGSSTTDSSP